MSDMLTRIMRSAPGKAVGAKVGLADPPRLPRRGDRPDGPLEPVVVLGAGAGANLIAQHLHDHGADVRRRFEGVRTVGSVVIALDDISHPDQIGPIVLPLAEAMRQLAPGSRIVTISRPATGEDMGRDAARGGIEGFVRSLGHEVRKGGTANGILVADDVTITAPSVLGALDFFLSPRSAYVNGQLLQIDADGTSSSAEGVGEGRLAGKTALVTGAARGIGAAIARTLAADGAEVVVLDVTAAGTDLARIASEIGGIAIQLDVTAADAPTRLFDQLRAHGVSLDILVLNAGITRDRMFANMAADRWDPVIAVNIASQIALAEALLAEEVADVRGSDLRVISLASTSGIAGNKGQTNYAVSKAGVIAFVDALADRLEKIGGTANAVAPGFIETEMTAKIPAVRREVARRMSSLQQGGQPADVAEAIAFLASPEAGGVRGQTLRVCGQHIVGR